MTTERSPEERAKDFGLPRINPPRPTVKDAYHALLVAPFSLVILLFFVVYIAANAGFAGIYLMCGDGAISSAAPGSFWDAMTFSVQTMTTIGYGEFRPVTTAANVIAGIEAFTGLMGFAFATGIMYAKFAQPTAHVIFSNVMTLARMHDEDDVLALRIANARRSQIAEARATATLIWREDLVDGGRFVRFHDLKLHRAQSPVFTLTWTLMHPLDENSPIRGMSIDDLIAREARFLITVAGIDQTFHDHVHVRAMYKPGDIRPGHRFVDVIVPGPDGENVLDYANFHDTLAVDEDGADA